MSTHAISRKPMAVAAALALVAIGAAPAPSVHRPMSIQNRLLLNHATIAGLETLEVMLLVEPDKLSEVTARITTLGGHVEKQDSDVGYMRVTVPTVKLLDLVDAKDIDSYEISSFSRGRWYREGWPKLEADADRYSESASPIAFASNTPATLPLLTPRESRASGYTADDDTGVGEWMRRHPTYDGRGVTIALLETAQPDFTRLISSTAKTIDGRDVPKLAGIVNAIDPDAPDETRVLLDTAVDAMSTWVRIGGRTYIIPRAGRYRFGVFTMPQGGNVVQEFGLLEDEQTGDIRVDTNGDASFQDETPIADVNDRLEVQFLKLRTPHTFNLGFVMAHGRRPHTIHVYCGRSDHQTSTLSVAAGSRSDQSLAFGVAPNARVLLVRALSPRYRFVDFIEGYLAAAARADVDIVGDSVAMTIDPDTAADFMGLLFTRIVAVRGKPLFEAGGNTQLVLSSAHPADGAFSVGGSISPEGFAALYGGGTLKIVIAHPTSPGGPSMDGGVKPDFLAPMQRLATVVPWAPGVSLPKNAPTRSTGPGYEVSCCTSASSPYAAGFAALLLSAAKQEHVAYSVASLGRALRIGARFLPDTPSYLQGNGVLDVNAAWRELTHPLDVPIIRSMARIVHPLAPYAAHGSRGRGIFEVGGWTAGVTGRRAIELRRESGPAQPVAYRLTWMGNDGTFATAPTITLPLRHTVSLPVEISVTAPGVHSALLNVHETATDRIVFRTQATVVAPEPVDPATGVIHLKGIVPLMEMRTHYIDVPAGTGAVEITVRVLRGILRPTVVASHRLYSPSAEQPVLGVGPQFGQGSHTCVVAHPIAGMWSIDLVNLAAWWEHKKMDGVEAEYAVDVRLLRAAIDVRAPTGIAPAVDIQNRGSAIREPVLETSDAMVASRDGTFVPSGLPTLFDVTVPANVSALLIRAHDSRDPLEMYLYDCVTGECFLQDFTIPMSTDQVLEVRRPHAGRWRVAVNSAADPAAAGRFRLDEIVTIGEPRRAALPHPLAAGEASTFTVPIARTSADHSILYTLIDTAVEREVRENTWTDDARFPPIVNRPVSGWAVEPIR